MLINNKSELDFKLKANIFTKFFADKCTPIQNNVILNFTEWESINRLTSIVFNDEIILKIIRALDANKAHGHDDILIQMIIKLCSKSIISALLLICKNCINSGIFPNIWKKSNVVPVHKKDDKQVVDIYRPVSILPIFGTVFEKAYF